MVFSSFSAAAVVSFSLFALLIENTKLLKPQLYFDVYVYLLLLLFSFCIWARLFLFYFGCWINKSCVFFYFSVGFSWFLLFRSKCGKWFLSPMEKKCITKKYGDLRFTSFECGMVWIYRIFRIFSTRLVLCFIHFGL